MLSMPPETTMAAEPALMMSCASMVAFMPEPQTLLMVVAPRSEEHTSELQSRENLVCRLLLDPAPAVRCTRSQHDALPISAEPAWMMSCARMLAFMPDPHTWLIGRPP